MTPRAAIPVLPPALLAALALAALPAHAQAPGAALPALAAAAEALADALGPPPDGRRALALSVETRARALASPLEAALEAALARRGYAVTPARVPATEAEAAARASGQDWLVRVQAGLVPGRRELSLVGEVIPAWASFFLQHRPGARAIPPRLVQARAAADPDTLLLAREDRPAGAGFASVRALGQVPDEVLALAVGEPGEGGVRAIVAVTSTEAWVLSAGGAPVARRALEPGERTPVRAPAAALALGEFGGGRIAVRLAGAARGEVLALRDGALQPAGALDGTPVCAADGVRVWGAFAPGRGELLDRLAADPASLTAAPPAAAGAAPAAPRRLYRVTAAPHGGRVAVAALGVDGRLDLLGPDLAPAAAPLRGVGAGLALADLDGDGAPELVASEPGPGAPDRVRVLRTSGGPPLLESGPVAGRILAGAGGDLTGDGVDDAVLASVAAGPDGRPVTTLLLVSADAREAR
ncbi:FG-GAP repeat protein [Anaeromyxobacter sp. K]|uniref:VCBS repeat-containing protein n=1 Tax=Anaeromyxobacter sp. (strain K) TaxID=447217 RepID=UPI00017BE3A8|nr:VCBS repeat-containing protein [Anaeromyxobacter sp. K]ACG74634.1 FG-GAP repeat protein [Anaeromyxobacter sp. K]